MNRTQLVQEATDRAYAMQDEQPETAALIARLANMLGNLVDAGPYTLGYTDGMTQGRDDAIRTLARVFRKLLSAEERETLTRWLTGADHMDEFLAVLRDSGTVHSERRTGDEK